MTKKEREKLFAQIETWKKEKGIKDIDPLDLIPGAGTVKSLTKSRKSLLEVLKKLKAAKKSPLHLDSAKEISSKIKKMLTRKSKIKEDLFELQEKDFKKKTAVNKIKKDDQELADIIKENKKLRSLSNILDKFKTTKKARTDLEDAKHTASFKKLVYPILEPDKIRSAYKTKGLDRSIADIERENSTLRNLINKAQDTDATKVIGAHEKNPVKLNIILKNFLKKLTKEKVKGKMN